MGEPETTGYRELLGDGHYILCFSRAGGTRTLMERAPADSESVTSPAPLLPSVYSSVMRISCAFLLYCGWRNPQRVFGDEIASPKSFLATWKVPLDPDLTRLLEPIGL